MLGLADGGFTVDVGWTFASGQTLVGLGAGAASALLLCRVSGFGRKDALKVGILSGYTTGLAYVMGMTLLLVHLRASHLELLLLLDIVIIILYTLLGAVGALVFTILWNVVRRYGVNPKP